MELNYDLLKETNEQIEKNKFLKKGIIIDDEEYEVIHNLEEAKFNVFEAFFDYKDEEGLSWGDILEENMAKLWKSVFESDNSSNLTKLINGLTILEINIDNNDENFDMIDEIEYELMLCAKSRLICGKDNEFFESLFKAFMSGGWPCGWIDGKIIVYVPENN